MIKVIKDFEHLEKYTKLVEKQLFQDLWDMIYKPMFKILGLKAANNKNPIIEALDKGKIYYENGGFKARDKFSNEVSKALIKLGAKYDRWEKSYKIAIEDIPEDIWKAIKENIIETRAKLTQINDFLADVELNLDQIIDTMLFNNQVETILDDVGNQVTRNVKHLNVIEPDLTKEQEEDIARNYTNNMQFYIKKWAKDKIPEMRLKVQQAILDGYRRDEVQKMLETEYGIAERKAKFLAYNETSIMLAELKKVMYQEMGFDHFMWITNLDNRERPLHRELHGRIFRFDNPPVIDARTGQTGLPGETYNCLTGDMQITSPFLHNRIFKRKFRGETITLITSVGRIKLTPNHPVLTDKGWVKASSLNIGDNIAKISEETFLAGGSYPNNAKTTIEEFFSFYSILFMQKRVALSDNDFHGDISVDKQVNTINIKTVLRNYVKPDISKSRIDQILTEANELFGSMDTSSNRAFLQAFPFCRFITDSFIGSLDKAFSFFFGSESHTIEHTFRAIAWLDSFLYEMTGYDSTRNGIFLSKLLNAPTGSIKFYQLILWELVYSLIDRNITEFFHSANNCFSFNAESLGKFRQGFPAPIEFDKITDKIVSIFDGHIYNLENTNNWYLTDKYITKNCRCQIRPIMTDNPFFTTDSNAEAEYRESYKRIMGHKDFPDVNQPFKYPTRT